MQFCWFILFALYCTSLAQTPQTCTFTNSNNQQFDLSPLSNAKADYQINYDTTDPKKLMWLNMCRPVITGVCGTGIAGCQQWDSASGKASMGTATSQQISWGTQYFGEAGLMATYTGGTPVNNIPRSMEIDFICAEGASVGAPTFLSESKSNFKYYFEWKTQYACTPNGPSSTGASTTGAGSGGLSGGSVFLIIFFVAVVVYFAGGIAYMRFKNHAEGLDMIPNLEFWASLPGLIKDGGKFTIGKVTGKGSSSGTPYTPVK